MRRLLPLILLCAALIAAVGGTVTTSTSTGGLNVRDLKASASATKEERSDRKFKKGEGVRLDFVIEGFKQADDDMIWVQQDLEVTAPDGKSVLKKENILDKHEKGPKGADTLTTYNEITLPGDAPPGEYKITIAIRDKIGGGTHNQNLNFTVE